MPSSAALQRRKAARPDQGYDANYLAQKFGITPAQARQVIAEVGNDREKLNEAAAKLKRPIVKRGSGCPF